MNYQQAIDFLYSQLPMFTRDGASAYKKDLDNTLALCAAYDNPQHKFKSIHIAGTNGKGSTASMLAAIFTKAGFKTGLYTSPHITQFEERIRINGEMIPPETVAAFVTDSEQLCKKIQPSFFELTVVMAFNYFADEKVDIAIIECGLGGRLDSTNVITPLLSIITNIGLDHMNILGDTVEKIAMEKAGIIKQNIPVVIGRADEGLYTVFDEKAEEMSAPLFLASEIFQYKRRNENGDFNYYYLPSQRTIQASTDLQGNYQAENLATVLTAVQVLNMCSEFTFDNEALVAQALNEVALLTGIRGRWEIVHEHPIVIYDVAHNEDGITQVVAQINEQFFGKKIHIVLGFVKDKSLEKVLCILPGTAIYYFTNADIPRALPANELAKLCSAKGLEGTVCAAPGLALKTALLAASEDDVIIVCGSFFILSELPAGASFDQWMA